MVLLILRREGWGKVGLRYGPTKLVVLRYGRTKFS